MSLLLTYVCVFFLSSRRRHTSCALVTGVQTCALPIFSPAEIADYEKQVAVRQERRAGEMEAWLDKIAENRHDPIYVGMMWGTAWQVVEALRARSEERRVGKGWVSTGRSRWSPDH